MKHSEDPGNSFDQALAQRFRDMRQLEAASAPAVPDAELLGAATRNRSRHWLLQHKPQLAVAASLLFATVVLLRQPLFQSETQDPGAIYANIMAANHMTTDPLLLMDDGIAPESASLPRVFAIDAQLFTRERN